MTYMGLFLFLDLVTHVGKELLQDYKFMLQSIKFKNGKEKCGRLNMKYQIV